MHSTDLIFHMNELGMRSRPHNDKNNFVQRSPLPYFASAKWKERDQVVPLLVVY